MIDLIDRTKLEPDTEWNEYDDDYVSYSSYQIKGAPTVKAVPLDKVKQAREEIEELATEEIQVYDEENPYISGVVEYVSLIEVRELLDELIAESEGI